MAAIPVLSNLDFSKNQALNIVIHQSAAAPAGPLQGQIYFNTTDNIFYYYNNSVWVALSSYAPGTGLTSSTAEGVTTFNLNVDNATLEVSGNVVRIKDVGVTTAKLANNAVTTIKVTDKNITLAKIQDLTAMRVIGSITGGAPIQIPILDEDDLVSDSNTSLATQQSVKAYVDARVAGLGKLIGGFDAATATNFPTPAGTKKGDYWYVTVAGTVQSQIFEIGDVIIANQDTPVGTNANHYIFLQTNRDRATTTVLGMVILATNTETQAGVISDKVITPAGLSARTATETRTGIARISTLVEATAGTDDTTIMTPVKVKAVFSALTGYYVANIGDGTAITYTITHGLGTKDVKVEVYNIATGQTIITDVERDTIGTVKVNFTPQTIPAENSYRVLMSKIVI